MQVRQMLVTPEQAAKWLEGNTHNRPLRQGTVDRYTRDMRDGKWRLTHQGIAFDDNNTLVDGQHRLWAVLNSEKPIEFIVTRGLDMAAQEFIDGGEKRTTSDVLALRGEKTSPLVSGVVTILAAQLFKVDNPTRGEQLAVYGDHKDAINFAVSTFTRNIRGVRTARVVAPMTRASYLWPRTDLMRFGAVLSEGVSETKRDAPIIMLRNWLLERNPKRTEIYGKTERALQAFLTEETIKSLYAASDELFLLPEEQARLDRAKATTTGRRKSTTTAKKAARSTR